MYKCIKDVKCEKCKYPEVKVRYKEMDLCHRKEQIQSVNLRKQ